MSDTDHSNLNITDAFPRHPGVVETLDRAGLINKQLHGVVELDDENRDRILDLLYQLAQEWPLFNKDVLFSGWVRVAQRGFHDEYPTDADSAARVEVPSEAVSLGFDLVERDDEVYVAHMLGFDITDSGRIVYPKSRKAPMYIGRAELDQVIIKDALDEHYDNRDYIEKYHGKAADAVLGCLIEAEDEVDVLENLKRLVVSIKGMQDPHEFNHRLTKYISRDILFNKILPYTAKFKGPVLEIDGEGSVTDAFVCSQMWQDVLILPERVQFLPCPVKDSEGRLVYSDEHSIPYLVVSASRLDDLGSNRSAAIAIPISENLLVRSNAAKIYPIDEPE